MLPGAEPEEQPSDQEENGNGADTVVGFAGNVRDKAHEGGAEEGSAFSNDVVKSKVLSGLFCRDDLRKVRAAHRLDASLEHADDNSEDPELVKGIEEQPIHADEEVSDNTHHNDALRFKLSGKSSDDEGRRERHYLSNQEGCQQPDGVES